MTDETLNALNTISSKTIVRHQTCLGFSTALHVSRKLCNFHFLPNNPFFFFYPAHNQSFQPAPVSDCIVFMRQFGAELQSSPLKPLSDLSPVHFVFYLDCDTETCSLSTLQLGEDMMCTSIHHGSKFSLSL